MKKLFAILAVAALVVACGEEKPKTVEEQCLDHLANIERAVEAEDFEAADAAFAAYGEWISTLDEADYEKVMEVVWENEERIELLSIVASRGDLGCDCCDEDYDMYEEDYDKGGKNARNVYDEDYEEAYDMYEEAYDEARDMYEEAYDEARDMYEEAYDEARDMYEEAYDEAMEEYEDAMEDAMNAAFGF